jgi:hypothetical protein
VDLLIEEAEGVTAKEGGSKAFIKHANVCEGLYWTTHEQFCNHTVYRQEPAASDAPNNRELYMFFWASDLGCGDGEPVQSDELSSMNGWYLATQVVCLNASNKNSPKEIAKRTNSCELFGWSPPFGHQYIAFPQVWNIPCKRTVPCTSLVVQPTIDWAADKIGSLQEELDTLKLSGGSPKPPTGVPQSQGEQLRGPMVSKHCLGAGWFERCSALVRLTLNCHHEAHTLAEELHADSKHIRKKVTEFTHMQSERKSLSVGKKCRI